MVEQADALEAKFRKHHNGATSIEKFYDSLPGDGEAWTHVTDVGARIRALLNDDSRSERAVQALSEEETRLIRLVLHGSGASWSAALELELAQAELVLSRIAPLLAPLRSIAIPTHMPIIPPPGLRGRDVDWEAAVRGLSDFDAVQAALHVTSVAAALTGDSQTADEYTVLGAKLVASLVPTNLLNSFAVIGARTDLARRLIELEQAGSLDSSTQLRVSDILQRSPLLLQHVPPGLILGMIDGDLPDGTRVRFSDLVAEWKPADSGFIDRLFPDYNTIRRVLDHLTVFAEMLDQDTPIGRVFAPLPIDATLSDAASLIELSECHADTAITIFCGMVNRAGVFRAMSNLAIEDRGADPSRSPNADTSRYHDLESLGYAGIGATQVSGKAVGAGNQRVKAPWKLALAAVAAPLFELDEGRVMEPELVVAVPAGLVKHGTVELITDQPTAAPIRIEFTQWRSLGDNDWRGIPPTASTQVADPKALHALPDDTIVMAKIKARVGEHHILALSFPRSAPRSNNPR